MRPPRRHAPQTADAWAAHARDRLAAAGHRGGGARSALIDSLARQRCCRSAQEIHDDLRGEGRRVGLASVYRTLDLLAALGLVQRLELGGAAARFEPALPGGEHHHHLVCIDCGEVRPFEDERLERALEGSGSSSGFSVEGHDVVLRGRCPRCMAA